MRSVRADFFVSFLLVFLSSLGCSTEQDKIRPPLPEIRSVVPQAGSTDTKSSIEKPAPTVGEQFSPDPDAVIMATEWIDTLNEVVEQCAKHVLSGKIFKGTKPAPGVAKNIRRFCPLFEKVPPARLMALLGLSNDLDQALQSYAALQAELNHLDALLSDRIEVPSHRFSELLAKRKTSLHRGISDVRNGIRNAANDLLDGSLENPSVEALSALVPDPETLVQTATHLVNRFVTGPVWQALIQDVRYRLIKGRPIYQTRDILVIKSARIQTERIRTRIKKITERRAEFKGGQDEYWAAVLDYLTEMEGIAVNLHKALDYDSRVLVLTQLQRIPKGSRKEIRDRARDWSTQVKAFVQAAQPKSVPDKP